MNRIDTLELRLFQKLVLAVAAPIVVAIAMFSTVLVGADPTSGRDVPSSLAMGDGCAHLIRPGETLTGIGRVHGLSVGELTSLNSIVDANRIEAGATIRVCSGTVDGKQVSGLPGYAAQWAQAVVDEAPDGASDNDIAFLVSVAGPESEWCTNTVNVGDANPPVWGPSVGCIQVRTLLRPSDLVKEPFRDRAWLEASFNNQAEAAWAILRLQGKRAWGPTRNGVMPNGNPADCVAASNPGRCNVWWQIGAEALNGVAM